MTVHLYDTRAIHLGLVADYSNTQFLLEFRRFISGRGAPNYIFSDNAPNFRLGREVLISELQQLSVNKVVKDFTTNTVAIYHSTIWKGVFYERRVGSMKAALKNTVHRTILDVCNLQTLFTKVESTLNTCPLTPVTSDANGGPGVLLPIDLITPNFDLGHLGSPSETVTTKDPLSLLDF